MTKFFQYIVIALSLVSAFGGVCDALRLNDVYQKNSHNSYSRMESVGDQMAFHHIRSLEYDVHIGRSGCNNGGSAVAGNWYIYHACVADDSTMVRFLSDGLIEIKAFHDQNPNHEVLTLFIDLQDDLQAPGGGAHGPDEFDALLMTHLGSFLYTPSNLLAAGGNAANLKAALSNLGGWPELSTLQGKIMVFITKGQASYANTDALANAAKAFVTTGGITSLPTNTFTVVANQDGTNSAQQTFSQTLSANRYLVRHWYTVSGSMTSSNWAASVANKANIIAHNLINSQTDPAFCTHNTVTAYPFKAFTGTALSGVYETRNVLSLLITSEDVWGSSDNMFFLHTTTTGPWTAMISTPNSHVPDDWAKGGIMARESTAAGARYFAVIRGADDNVLRIQYRTCTGCSTTAVNAPTIGTSGSEQQSRSIVKLNCVYSTTTLNTVCSGFGSQDGTTWVQIGSTITFTGVNLSRSGPFASSHGNHVMPDGTRTKFIFGNLKQGTTLKTTTAFTQSVVGTVYGSQTCKDSVY